MERKTHIPEIFAALFCGAESDMRLTVNTSRSDGQKQRSRRR